ncbi:MAG: hypothetical protein JWR60_1725 [Polaromonas sp.]|nr:hypothetical protein [Polaromonas sp.]
MGRMNDLLTGDLFPQSLLPVVPVVLQGPADLEGFRRAARCLLARQILPTQVAWQIGGAPHAAAARAANADVFNDGSDAPAVKVPAEFMALCESVVLHRDPARFGLLYRILWRLAHEPGLRRDPLDADVLQARQMAQAVQLDMQRMKAFVRFRTVQDDRFRTQPEGGPLHLAWFEPEHHIVEAVAPFFARRFGQMRWAILTPERSIEWDCVRPRARGVLPFSRRFASGGAAEGSGAGARAFAGVAGGACGAGADATGGMAVPAALQAAPGQPVAMQARSPATVTAPERPGAMRGQLRFGPGAQKGDRPLADAGDQRWLRFYQRAFPAAHPALHPAPGGPAAAASARPNWRLRRLAGRFGGR